jgi:dsRNA-specific ribonuclease
MMDAKFLLLLLSTLSLTLAAPDMIKGQGLPQSEPLEEPSTPVDPPVLDSESSTEAEPSAEQTTPTPASADSEDPAAQSRLDDEQEALIAALNLSDEQRDQFQSIQALLQAQVKSILTPQQMQQVAKLSSAGQKPNVSTLNLSADQQSKLAEAQKLASYRFSVLLTPAQKEAFKKILQEQRN